MKYDLIINLYPFFLRGVLKEAGCPVAVPFKYVANIVTNTQCNAPKRPHVLLQLNDYLSN